MIANRLSMPWQQRRSAFNHDWLKNTYINRLRDFVGRLEAEDRDPVRTPRFLHEDLSQWREHRKEALWLTEHFEDSMSPRTMFELPPLNSVAPKTRTWLPGLIHELWRVRNGVTGSVQGLKNLVALVDDNYRSINAILYEEGHAGVLASPELPSVARRLLEACVALSEGLSALPREILIV